MRAPRFCVYAAATGRTVEGGFFARDAAQASAEQWTRETGTRHVAGPQHERDSTPARDSTGAALLAVLS